MKYGTENEDNGLKKYSHRKQVSVAKTGLWINKNYVHLAGSPDGLAFDDNGKLVGFVEVKCLNILELHSVENIVAKNCPINEIKRQCFDVKNGQLVLKKSHTYTFYQVQLQLLVTNGDYCDFVLYSAVGPPSIERIYPDMELQKRIVDSTKLFWEKVFLPEYFLMRVPKGLLPILL